MRALVPVPHGERSSQPGWIETAARASAPSRPGAVKMTWRTPAIRSSSGCTGRSAASIAVHHARARLDQLRRVLGRDLDAGPRRRRRSRRSCRRRRGRRRAARRRARRSRRGARGRRGRCAASPTRASPSSHRHAHLDRPAGVSSRITVSGSVTATIPVSTSTVATPIVPCPHIGRQPETSMKSTPQSASGRVGGCRIAPDIAACPRGSRISSRRRSSRSASKCSLRSSIVAPGSGPTPPVMTRVGMPSVWESTAAKTRAALKRAPAARGARRAPRRAPRDPRR